jgi:hypothetical protein
VLLNVQLQIGRSALKQIAQSVLRLLACIFWLTWPENLQLYEALQHCRCFLQCSEFAAVVLLLCSPCVHTPYLSCNLTHGNLMGSDPVTVVANSVHCHDQSIDFGIYDSNTALWPDWNEAVLPTGYTCPQVQDAECAGCVTDKMYYQHDGTPPHFSQVIRQYLNHKFPDRLIGHVGAQNWPPRSPDLNPLDFLVWGYMKAMLYAHKVNTREELLQRILSTAKSINNAAVLRRVTCSLVTRVRKYFQADGGHFEQIAWVLNSLSVTVHLTAQLNKCTVLLFPF